MIKPFLTKTKWVFIDLDNTLWDFDGNAQEALKILYTKHRLDHLCHCTVSDFLGLYKSINASLWRRYEAGELDKETLRTTRFSDTFTAMGISIVQQPKNIWQEYLDICPLMPRLMPFALEALAKLKKKYKIAILTNGFETTQRIKLGHSGIGDFIDFMITSEGVGFAKPQTEFFALALSKAQCSAEEAVYLGDTWHTDVLGGMGAGIISYWYSNHTIGIQSESPPMNDIMDMNLYGGSVSDLRLFSSL